MTPTSQTSDLEYADYLDALAEDFEADGYEQTATDIAGAALRIKFLVAELKGRNVLLDAYRKSVERYDLAGTKQQFAADKEDLQEVRIEISRVNEAAGQTVFNPAATQALDSILGDLS